MVIKRLTVVDKSMMRRRKIRAGFITLQAKKRDPIRESNCDLRHFLRDRHVTTEDERPESLSDSSRIVKFSESISILKKEMT